MKKSLLTLGLALSMAFSLQACSWMGESGSSSSNSTSGTSSSVGASEDETSSEESSSEIANTSSSEDNSSTKKETVTITFRQSGYSDVVKTITVGEALTDIPDTQEKIGHTVEWETTNFKNVSEDIVVKAVETPNTYTITYDVGEGSVTPKQQEVVYDSEPTLAIPERSGYKFTGWYYGDNAVVGKWKIAEDVTLVAGWIRDSQDTYTIIFKQADQTDVVFDNIVSGSNFTEIPSVVNKTGYTIEWNASDLEKLSNVAENIIVNAVETPKKYTLTLNSNGGDCETKTIEVIYDASYELPIAQHEEKKFVCWCYNGVELPMLGTWNIDVDSEIELVAQWGGNIWTGNW